MFFHKSLKLLLHLADLSPKAVSLGALRSRFLFGLRQRLLKGRHLSRGPYNKQYNPVTLFAIKAFYRHFFCKVFLTFFLLEPLLGKAELLLGPLEVLLQDCPPPQSVRRWIAAKPAYAY